MGCSASLSSGNFINKGVSATIDKGSNTSRRRIILIGQTGAGKSTLGNAIVGGKRFETEGVQMQSNTKYSKVVVGKSSGSNDICVLDTPGLTGTTRDKEEIISEMQKYIDDVEPGPHVFCLVIRGDVRFTEESKQILDEYCSVFGEDIYKYTIIVFTHQAGMGKYATVDDCLGAIDHEFRDKFRNGKKIAIESTAEKKELQKQIEELVILIEEVVQINKEGYYSKDKFNAAKEAFRKHITKRQQEVDKVIEGKINSVKNEYQNREKQLKEELQKTTDTLKLVQDELETLKNKSLLEKGKEVVVGAAGKAVGTVYDVAAEKLSGVLGNVAKLVNPK